VKRILFLHFQPEEQVSGTRETSPEGALVRCTRARGQRK
jgi:hypothetical protein